MNIWASLQTGKEHLASVKLAVHFPTAYQTTAQCIGWIQQAILIACQLKGLGWLNFFESFNPHSHYPNIICFQETSFNTCKYFKHVLAL